MSILSDELALPAYTDLSDAEAAALLNDRTIPSLVDFNVNAKTILSTLGAVNGATFLDALETVAVGNSAVKWMLSFIKSDGGVNVGDIETRNALDGLVQAGVLDGADVATIKALAETTISRAEELGIRVDTSDIQRLRGSI